MEGSQQGQDEWWGTSLTNLWVFIEGLPVAHKRSGDSILAKVNMLTIRERPNHLDDAVPAGYYAGTSTVGCYKDLYSSTVARHES